MFSCRTNGQATKSAVNDLKSIFKFSWQLLLHPSQRKHVCRWLASQQPSYVLRYGQPWIVFDAMDSLQSLDLGGKQIFEYGSGGSTLFWLRHNAVCVSIEHDPEWFALVRGYCASARAIDYRLILPEPAGPQAAPGDPADPDCYLSDDAQYRSSTFLRYVSQIDAFPDATFDIILIDGRARPACIKHSVGKVRVGGMIIVDNSDRDYYFSKTQSYLENFARQDFCGVGPLNPQWSQTTVFSRQK